MHRRQILITGRLGNDVYGWSLKPLTGRLRVFSFGHLLVRMFLCCFLFVCLFMFVFCLFVCFTVVRAYVDLFFAPRALFITPTSTHLLIINKTQQLSQSSLSQLLKTCSSLSFFVDPLSVTICLRKLPPPRSVFQLGSDYRSFALPCRLLRKRRKMCCSHFPTPYLGRFKALVTRCQTKGNWNCRAPGWSGPK